MRKLLGRKSWTPFRGVLVVFLLVLFYVAGMRRQDFYGEQKETAIGWDTTVAPGEIAGIGPDTEIRQVFFAQDGILNLIYVAVDGHGQTGNMVVTVRDAAGATVAVRELPCAQLVESGAQGIHVNVRVTPGAEYSYTITFAGVEDAYPVIRTAPCLSEGELGALYVNGTKQEQPIYGLFVYQSYYTQSFAWRVCVAVALVMLLYAALYPVLPVWETRLLPVFLAVHVALGVFLLELAAGTALAELGAKRYWYNALLCGWLFLALSLLLWRGGVWLKAGTVLCFVLGVAEYYVLEFRGTPLVLADLRSAGTASEVSGAYRFDIPVEMLAALFVMLAVFAVEHKVRFRRYPVRRRLVFRGALLLLGVGSFFYLRSLPLLATGNNGGFFWDLASSYEKYGYFLGTYIYESYQVVEKPKDYSQEGVLELIARLEGAETSETEHERATETSQTEHEYATETWETEQERAAESSDSEQLPNIIVVMNESFADFAAVGGLETSQPVTPFLDSLEENTVRGNLYVSVFGGGTANTEFEFLTGSTMQFLPRGSTPYQAYVKRELPSLASYLKTLDYTSLVCHFANRTNWNRHKVYPLLGFDTYLSEEDAGELEEIHGYPSDSENYRKLLEYYESWKESGETEHFFCFNVTIQNHGGYVSGYRSPDAPHYTGGQTADDVEEYLSLLRESDRAFEELVSYFEKEQEPTVILMFGDHWPRLNNRFISAMANQAGEVGALEKNQNKYTTPFVIWANYDIEEAQIERLSANYLGELLLRTAGVPENGYQRFLQKAAQEVPVIDALGYVDADGLYVDEAEQLDEARLELVEQYQTLQYANLFGRIEGAETFFG